MRLDEIPALPFSISGELCFADVAQPVCQFEGLPFWAHFRDLREQDIAPQLPPRLITQPVRFFGGWLPSRDFPHPGQNFCTESSLQIFAEHGRAFFENIMEQGGHKFRFGSYSAYPPQVGHHLNRMANIGKGMVSIAELSLVGLGGKGNRFFNQESSRAGERQGQVSATCTNPSRSRIERLVGVG